MGGSVSTGVDNDDLIDNLKEGKYIKTVEIERIFRTVDRQDYVLPESRPHAYRDTAWKEGHLHLSAPCIYAEVMEALHLEPGQAFLNIGSGTGYLSTMVGLALGCNGINHGVEYHESNVKYAIDHLQAFMKTSVALRYFDFAIPKFVVGNAMSLIANKQNLRYDRIYIGAACDEIADVKFFAKFLKIGGMMVVPMENNLVRITRKHDSLENLEMENLMSCSFANLLPASNTCFHPVILPLENMRSLKSRCREVIIRALRNKFLNSRPDLFMPRAHHQHQHQRRIMRRVVFPLMIAQDDEDDEPHIILGNPVHSTDNGTNVPNSEELHLSDTGTQNSVNFAESNTGIQDSSSDVATVHQMETSANDVANNGITAYSLIEQFIADNVDHSGGAEIQSVTESSSAGIQAEEGNLSDSSDGSDGDGRNDGENRLRSKILKRRLSSRTSSESQNPEAPQEPSKRRSMIQLFLSRRAAATSSSEGTGTSTAAVAGSSIPQSPSSQNHGSETMIKTRHTSSVSSSQEESLTEADEDEMDDSEIMSPRDAENQLPPAARQMDSGIVNAISALGIAPAFARYLNFDRPLG